jgi:hypothetical protein
MGRVGELAWAMGRIPIFDLPESPAQIGMIPIKAVNVDISRAAAPPNGNAANQAFIDEWKKQALAQPPMPVPLAA